MSLRTDLNNGVLQQIADEFRQISLGELLSLVIKGITPTEAGIVVVPGVDTATLAAQPSALFQVNVTAGGTTGVKKLLKGPLTGPGAVVPASGECVWDGGLVIKFASVDAVTAVSATYAKSTDVASILMRSIDEVH